jgi:hypothetical protein
MGIDCWSDINWMISSYMRWQNLLSTDSDKVIKEQLECLNWYNLGAVNFSQKECCGGAVCISENINWTQISFTIFLYNYIYHPLSCLMNFIFLLKIIIQQLFFFYDFLGACQRKLQHYYREHWQNHNPTNRIWHARTYAVSDPKDLGWNRS